MNQAARHILCAGLASAMWIATAAPASAQALSRGSAEKSEAILGAPSSLASIIAAQSGGASVAALPKLVPALLEQATTPQMLAAVQPVINTTASLDRPDVFNSVAVPVVRTPLDERWSRVENSAVIGKAARFAAALRGQDQRVQLEAVNRYVNASIAFVDDSRQYGVVDKWETANAALASGRGDCEDYAIAKLAMLRRAGFADRDLYFVVLKDLVRRADHAVLVVRSEGRFLVLDNGTETIADSATIRDYRPILTFTAGQRFTHGYRRSTTPPMIMASGGVTRTAGEPAIATAAGTPSSPLASR
ncbi:MAG: transglutaminase-like cysteine peptidase [Pseudomonadota bacterium]|nr:transglutaminase-like cysteine peptidase [Pseudomonadota bacterium]